MQRQLQYQFVVGKIFFMVFTKAVFIRLKQITVKKCKIKIWNNYWNNNKVKYYNILKLIILQSSESHDLLEICVICWFGPQETFYIIINVTQILLYVFMDSWYIFHDCLING